MMTAFQQLHITPNLAAQLQTLATPNTLVIREATRREIGGLFDLEDLGPQQLAGFSGPQHVWRVSRFEALSRCGSIKARGRPWASKPQPLDYKPC